MLDTNAESRTGFGATNPITGKPLWESDIHTAYTTHTLPNGDTIAIRYSTSTPAAGDSSRWGLG